MSSSSQTETDIIGWKSKNNLGHYAGTFNIRELKAATAKQEISEFDGHMKGKYNNNNLDFDFSGKITKAGGVIFDKQGSAAKWDGILFPTGRLVMTNSDRNNMEFKLPKKHVWGTVFKANDNRWYAHGKANRLDAKGVKYGDYEGVFCLDNPKNGEWDITVCIRCTYTIKTQLCDAGQFAYQDVLGKLVLKGEEGIVTMGTDVHSDQPWKGTWFLNKNEINLVTAKGGKVNFTVGEFFKRQPDSFLD